MTMAEESVSYACADPLPQLVTYTNSVTNETKTESIPAKINSLQVVFDYSIFHTDDISFGGAKAEEEESKGGVLGSISDTVGSISDTVSNLFNGDNKATEGKENLVALEKCMVDNIWKAMLANDKMTWVEGYESQCAGLMIDEKTRRLQEGTSTLIEIQEDEPIVGDNAGVVAQPVVIDDAGMDQTQPVVIDDAGLNQTIVENPVTSDTADVDDAVSTFTGTKLIGMDSLPLDNIINPAGCSGGSSSCTSVRGVISASYIGTDKNAVSESIARMIQDGMKSGSLLCESSPATKLEFDAFVGTNYNGKNGHGVLIVDTKRGTEPAETPNDLTKYGTMFVVFVALLSVGVIFAVLYRRKAKKGRELGTAAGQDFEANLESGRSETPDSQSTQSEGKLMKMVEMTESPTRHGTSEVELSLSPRSVT